MLTQSEVNRILTQGVASAQAGKREEAFDLLLEVVEFDQYNELAWLWLSTVADSVDDQRVCLENVLTINPDNTNARKRLALSGNGIPVDAASLGLSLGPSSPPASDSIPLPASTPITLWPLVAFWTSASILFIGGGVVSLIEFADILINARGVIQNLKPIEVAWLPMSLFFVVFGFTGVGLALQLARRRPGGYYGSLIFGLVLTLIGPAASLILEPPNYLTTLCTGLMPAAAVLFTLTSMTGLETYAKSP